MAASRQAPATLLRAPETVAGYASPGAVQEGGILVDDAGNIAVIVNLAGTPTVVPISSTAAILAAFGPVTIAGTLVSAGGNPNATPTATLTITATTRNGTPFAGLLDVCFTFAATEFPTFTPSVGSNFGGPSNGLVASGILRIQTTAGGLYTAVVTLPTAGARTVTPVNFRVVPKDLAANVLNFSATVFGGP